MTLSELATEYQHTEEQLKVRIKELKCQLEKAGDPREKRTLEGRVKVLSVLRKNARDVGYMLEHYYERGYWRSGRYCIQSRQTNARRSVSRVSKDDKRRKRGVYRTTEEKSDSSNRQGADLPTAEVLVDVLLQWPQHDRHRK